MIETDAAGVAERTPTGSAACMIVDDHPDIRSLIRVILETANTDISVAGEAASGPEAIQQVDELDPVIVVIDEMMPGMDGIEAVTEIRRIRPAQRFVMCSAHLDDDLRGRAAAAGVDACVGKEDVLSLPEVVRAVAARD